MTSETPPDSIDTAAIPRTLLSRAVCFLPECESTNTEARRLALAGEPEGALILTDFQTAGRGRLDRSWQAPRGSSLLFSLLLRPPLAPARIQQAAMAVSLGVVAGIRLECRLEPRLKWPNDILIGGCKAGGLLCEAGLDGERLSYAIVGVGLNVNFDPQGVAGIPPEATSILVARGAAQSRTALLRAILRETEPRYRSVQRGDSLHAEWSRALETLGRYVRVTLPDGEIAGVAEGVDENGGLKLRLRNRMQRTVLAGDVVHVAAEDTPWMIDHRAV
jgi:BirA family biotin operon repressor/biotin-[acetyl-CoA-carboxylase] ligase